MNALFVIVLSSNIVAATPQELPLQEAPKLTCPSSPYESLPEGAWYWTRCEGGAIWCPRKRTAEWEGHV